MHYSARINALCLAMSRDNEPAPRLFALRAGFFRIWEARAVSAALLRSYCPMLEQRMLTGTVCGCGWRRPAL